MQQFWHSSSKFISKLISNSNELEVPAHQEWSAKILIYVPKRHEKWNSPQVYFGLSARWRLLQKICRNRAFLLFHSFFFLANGVAIREACYFVLGTVNNISKRNSQCLTVPQCYTSSDTAVVSKQAEANLLSIWKLKHSSNGCSRLGLLMPMSPQLFSLSYSSDFMFKYSYSSYMHKKVLNLASLMSVSQLNLNTRQQQCDFGPISC